MTTSIVCRVESRLVEQALGCADGEIADVLVGRRDVLPAKAELLDDHPLRDVRERSATSAAVIHRSGRYEAVASRPTCLTLSPRGCSG